MSYTGNGAEIPGTSSIMNLNKSLRSLGGAGAGAVAGAVVGLGGA